MEFQEKLAAANQLLESKGLRYRNYSPPLFVVLRQAGMQVPPPYFRSFVKNALTMGVFFGVGLSLFTALLMSIGFLPHRPMPASQLLTLLLMTLSASSILFGMAMAIYYRRSTVKHHIPSWSDFHPG